MQPRFRGEKSPRKIHVHPEPQNVFLCECKFFCRYKLSLYLRGGHTRSEWILNPMTGVRIRKHVKTQTWRGGSMKMEPECGRMIYKMGHQGAGRGPWTMSLLGALERAWPCPHLDFRLPASRTARGYICA